MDTAGFAIHLRHYWQRATTSFNNGDFPASTFFAITLIEEVGKARLLLDAALTGQLDGRAFRTHSAKYAFAVFSTLYVNARVSRIYGSEESRFAKWFRDGELFAIRNQALYAEWKDGDVVLPHQAIVRDDAFLLTCISGEVLAEVQGGMLCTGPEEWQEMLAEVDAFREKQGMESNADLPSPSSDRLDT